MPVATRSGLRLGIGQLAALTGRSVHTIRWYEAQGLLPVVPREGRRRVYSGRHVDWLALMERLRRAGMSVASLRDYTSLAQQGAATLEPTRALLTEHRAHVQERIAESRQALRLIDEKIAFYSEWIGSGKLPGGRRDKR